MRAIAVILSLVLILSISSYEQTEETHQVFVPVVMREYPNYRGVGSTYNQCDDVKRIGGSWYYSWRREPTICKDVEAVPMLWDEASVDKEIGGNSDWLLGFNEPDLPTQANITPTLAAELWHEIERVYPDKRLVSPSVLSLAWLNEWYGACRVLYGRAPRLDAIAVHCYGAWTAAGGAMTCIDTLGRFVDWAKAHDVPEVWITEYAFLPCWSEGEPGSIEFMDAMQTYFKSEPAITRHAWFQLSYEGRESWSWGSHCNTSLIDFKSGELTPLGVAYRGGL